MIDFVKVGQDVGVIGIVYQVKGVIWSWPWSLEVIEGVTMVV